MATVVTITIVLLIVFLIIVIGLLIAYQKQKLCFQGKVNTLLCCCAKITFFVLAHKARSYDLWIIPLCLLSKVFAILKGRV